MTKDEIKLEAPNGATFYAEIEGKIIYFFKSSHGYRQISRNLIAFFDGGIPTVDIKPL